MKNDKKNDTKWLSSILGLASLLILVPSVHAQARYSAERTPRFQVGAGYLYLDNDYSEKSAGGLTVWGDYDIWRFIGVEGEAHFGGIITPDDIGENSYMVGPRVSYHKRKATVYGKLMVGRGTITNQLFNLSSTYNEYAFGGGLEYRIKRKINIRAVDVEIEKWPNFEPHTLSPLLITFGASYIIR